MSYMMKYYNERDKKLKVKRRISKKYEVKISINKKKQKYK